jgi:hypothetical protein
LWTTSRRRLVAGDANGVGAQDTLLEQGGGAALGLLCVLGADVPEAEGRGGSGGGRPAVQAHKTENIGAAALEGGANQAAGAEVGGGAAGLDELDGGSGHGSGEESGESEELHLDGWVGLFLSGRRKCKSE